MTALMLPKILVIDDFFGRTLSDRRNEDRANLCGQYLLQDITGDETGKVNPLKIKKPVAQAVFCRGVKPVCSKLGDRVEHDLEGTIEIIRKGWETEKEGLLPWSLVLLDMCFYTGKVTDESTRDKGEGMPEGRDEDNYPAHYFGLKILTAIHDKFPDLPVVILSSKPRDEIAREFSNRGALGFLPREDENSPQKLQELIWRHGLIPDFSGEIVGYSKALLLALRTARRAAEKDRNVLLRGETGTGKELIARYIHHHGKKRENAPFVIVNSPALTSSLWESELFGVARRAATGVDERRGKIRSAENGDIFFDEIGDMLPETQAGVLRVLEYKEVTPVGSETSYPVDVRFLSATNIDIEARCDDGQFRSDLLYRLNQETVFLPPLRERTSDIPLLVEKFVRKAEGKNPGALKRQIEPAAVEKIFSYAWHGNIRQLETYIISAVNNNPDVEYLVPLHIDIPDQRNVPSQSEISPRISEKPVISTAYSPSTTNEGIDSLISLLENFSFETIEPHQLAGKLPQIQGAYAKFIARYLTAALKATAQVSPAYPKGKVRIHPAIKLIEGNSELPASKAADIVKKLLGIDVKAIELMLENETLKEALETSLKLRPQRPVNKSNKNNAD